MKERTFYCDEGEHQIRLNQYEIKTQKTNKGISTHAIAYCPLHPIQRMSFTIGRVKK